MPSLIRQQVTHHVDATGKRVPAGTPGAKKVSRKSTKYYGVNIPGQPPGKRVPLARDKLAAKRMLDDLVRRHERGQAGLPSKDQATAPLLEHLDEFAADMKLGLASRSRKRVRRPPNDKQLSQTVHRIRTVLDGCGFVHVADLSDAAPRKLGSYFRDRLALPRREGGLSHQTARHVLSAMNRFISWMSSKQMPVQDDLFAGLPGFDPTNNRVHSRRVLTPDEFARLLDVTKSSAKTYMRLTGQDRYFLYLCAYATGFRVLELAALTPESFRLDENPPVVTLTSKQTKNGRPASNPIPPSIADQLRKFLADRPAGKPVWPGKWWDTHTSRMIQRDLKAAGIAYRVEGTNGPEYVDFHSLRALYVTTLAGSGAGPKELQTLARHSTPQLTLNVYTKLQPGQLAAAVNRLPVPGDGNDSDAATSTGIVGLSPQQRDVALVMALTVLNMMFAPSGVSGGVNKNADSQ